MPSDSTPADPAAFDDDKSSTSSSTLASSSSSSSPPPPPPPSDTKPACNTKKDSREEKTGGSGKGGEITDIHLQQRSRDDGSGDGGREVTATRKKPSKRNARNGKIVDGDEEEEEEEIGLHMWERRGRIVLDAPWLGEGGRKGGKEGV